MQNTWNLYVLIIFFYLMSEISSMLTINTRHSVEVLYNYNIIFVRVMTWINPFAEEVQDNG